VRTAERDGLSANRMIVTANWQLCSRYVHTMWLADAVTIRDRKNVFGPRQKT